MNMTRHAHARRLQRLAGDPTGSLIVIAMVFVGIFMVLGVALYLLLASQTRAAETERSDVKAFNVAEAGIDAGMLSLKLNWPRRSSAVATVDSALLKAALQETVPDLWDPSRSSPTEFLQVTLYDNVDSVTGLTTSVPDPAAPKWDSNADGLMFVDSTSNVDDNRHRILVLAERQRWELTFPTNTAIWTQFVDSNGQGLEVSIEDGTPPVYYEVHDVTHKGLDPNPPEDFVPLPPSEFSSVVSEQLRRSLEKIAIDNHTYFSGPSASADASAYLNSGLAYCAVVYVKSDTSVNLSGNTQIGSVDEPVVVIIDTPDGSVNIWDFKGSGELYGILVTIGNSTLRGTTGTHGAMYCSGSILNQGNGSQGEVNFNKKVIQNINVQYTISVNIVPNTWEEYTLPISGG